MSLRTPVALALLLNAPAFALAQSTPSSAEDIVVTATRTPQAAKDAVRPVQVLTAEDIRLSGAGTVAELLATAGELSVSRNGGIGSTASVFIRGASAGHTAVLVDGVRIGSATLGSASLQNIPLALVERIEILAGPSSSLYGSDAIGGVVQVFTKTPARSPGVQVALTAGQHGLAQLAASYAQRLGDTELSLGLDSLYSRGHDITTAALPTHNPDRDPYREAGLSARVVHHLSADQEVGAQFLRSRSTLHYDATDAWGGGPMRDDRTEDRVQTLATHWRGRLGAGLESTVRLSRTWDQSADVSTYPGYFHTTQDQLSWLNQIGLGQGTLQAGLEWLRQSVDSDTAYAVESREVLGALAGWRARYGDVSVQADLRDDHNSQFGNHGTGQLGLAWQASAQWKLRAAAGTAFKAPSFNDLYYPYAGNAALKPERSRNVELGGDWTDGAVKLSATLFRNHIDDLIAWAPVSPGSSTWIPQNVNSARITGLSLLASAPLGPRTRLRANATWQDAVDAATDLRLARRARQSAGVHLVHDLGPVQVGTDLSLVGARYDLAGEAASSRMGGYGLVAVFGTWRLSPDWSLEGRVNNLGNRHHEEVQHYVPPSRQAQITLRWTPAL